MNRTASFTHTTGTTSRSVGLAANSGASQTGRVGKPEGSPQHSKNVNLWHASFSEVPWNLVNVTSLLPLRIR